jgi:HEAT repeat protein
MASEVINPVKIIAAITSEVVGGAFCGASVCAMPGSSAAIGDMVRDWRERRRLSQLDLAAEAEISQKHLSFIESGRSTPSRDMVIKLANELDVPLRERNALLLAAGFAPIYQDRTLDDPSLANALSMLERLLRATSESDETRGHAAFWLGQTRGRRGYEDVLSIARSQSASPHLREKAVFALSQSKEPGAVDELINLAKHDPTAHVRGQALFWLAQQAGKKAAGAVREALDDDPDAGVREKAVFAVSQLPDDQGIPMLIELMKAHRDRNVRKKAAFWLGQKHDPRALAAIEEVLRK